MKKIIKYIIMILFSIAFGSVVTYLTLSKKINITHIYNSTVHVEAYNSDIKSNASGFVYKIKNNKTYIVTNYHVVKGYDNIYVHNMHNKKTKAKLFYYIEKDDIAILLIDNDLDLKEPVLADSEKVHVGENIYVVGSPTGNKYIGTISHGIISYLNRRITINTNDGIITMNTIQIDAPINSGNSGSPVINNKGNIIGMISTKDENAIGVSFALPINYIKSKIDNNI